MTVIMHSPMLRRLGVAFGLLAALCAALPSNLTCDDCYGRGSLDAEPNPWYCNCDCNSANDPPVVPSFPLLRHFNITNVVIPLLPPTCRYTSLESATLQLTIASPVNAVASALVFSAISAYLPLLYSDQLVLRRLEPKGSLSNESVMIFDIRDDGTGNTYATGASGPIAVNLHVEHLTAAISAQPPPQWVSDLQLTSLATVAVSASKRYTVSYSIGTLAGYPLYLETVLFVAAAVALTVFLALVEANLNTNFVLATAAAPKLTAQTSGDAYEPAERGGPEKAAASDSDVDEDNIGRLPRQSSRARRKSVTSDGGDHDGSRRAWPEPSEVPSEQSEPAPLERKKSRAQSFFFTGT